MRVLLWMAGAGIIPGGHKTQLEQTSRHLQILGVDAEVSFEDNPDIEGFDLVHGFSLSPSHIRRCRQRGLPTALSTIYWSKAYTSSQQSIGNRMATLQTRAHMAMVLLRSAALGQHVVKCEALVERIQMTRIAYEMVDLLLPNSELEAITIKAELGTTTPYHIVPNAVDHIRFNTNRVTTYERDHVLYAGRIEPHKNQLGLIKAMSRSTIPVVILGPPHPHHTPYYEECKRCATSNIKLLPGVPHEELPDLYRAAKVHVLPSWFETTGLVSLEAALCGSNIVTTDRGYAREYFQDFAWYCDPSDPRSIRRAIEDAYRSPTRTGLQDRILNNFTWEHTAQATLEGYEQLLRRTKSHVQNLLP